MCGRGGGSYGQERPTRNALPSHGPALASCRTPSRHEGSCLSATLQEHAVAAAHQAQGGVPLGVGWPELGALGIPDPSSDLVVAGRPTQLLKGLEPLRQGLHGPDARLSTATPSQLPSELGGGCSRWSRSASHPLGHSTRTRHLFLIACATPLLPSRDSQ